MNEDIKCFLNKGTILNQDFPEVNAIDFYNDIFPIGSFQDNANEMDSKGNGLVVEIRSDKKSRHHLITESREQIGTLIDLDFVITSPISYFGRNRTSKNASELYGMAFDLDGVSEKSLGNLLHQINHISIKDEQIVRQQEQIDHLKRLLENQRILTLKTQEKVEALENKEKHQLLS